MARTAKCHCERVILRCPEEPVEVVQCHCQACQRRTGSAFNLAAWYAIEDVKISGTTSRYERTGDIGIRTSFHFCPECGSNIFWTSDDGSIGVAVGCFADPEFPPPTVTIYDSKRHHWLERLATPTHSGNGES